MDNMDKALDALKIQIKKEIIDNYFAARCDLEEDHSALECKMADYRHDLTNLSPLFLAFYAALGRDASPCLDCAVESCLAGCPNGLPVPLKLRAAHGSLSFRGIA